MKRFLAAIACVAVILMSALSASALSKEFISPTTRPVSPPSNPVSPKTGYSVMTEVGAIAAVVSCSAAGIVLLKKDK